jgi:hypothetical protein
VSPQTLPWRAGCVAERNGAACGDLDRLARAKARAHQPAMIEPRGLVLGLREEGLLHEIPLFVKAQCEFPIGVFDFL